MLLTVRRVFNRSAVSFGISDNLSKGRMEMNGNDGLIIHAISHFREKLKKRPDKVTITNFVHSRHGLSHTVVADIMAQLEARGVIFRKVKKRIHSFFIADLDEDEALLYWRRRLKTVMSRGKKRRNSVKVFVHPVPTALPRPSWISSAPNLNKQNYDSPIRS